MSKWNEKGEDWLRLRSRSGSELYRVAFAAFLILRRYIERAVFRKRLTPLFFYVRDRPGVVYARDYRIGKAREAQSFAN